MTSDAWINMLGFDPAEMGLDETAMSLLRDPADQTAGLFASMRPFEEEQTNESILGLRNALGAMGGRFSRNLLDAEVDMRGELGNQFARSRQEALLGANAQRSQALQHIMASVLGARGQAFQESFAPWQSTLDFFRPGGPIQQEGALPGLVGAGLNLFGILKLLGSRSPSPTGGGGGIPLDTRGGSGTPLMPGWR